MKHLLALDQGTTSSRSIVFDAQGRVVALAQHEFGQHYPQPGWVEHDADEIWRTHAARAARKLRRGSGKPDIAAIGITNQRETTVVLFDRRTGEPLHRAIVWQDRRTAGALRAARFANAERMRARALASPLRPVLFSGEDRLAGRARPRCARRARAGRTRAGDHRCVARAQADRRRAVRDGAEQRLADLAARHCARARGGRGIAGSSASRRAACRRCAPRRDFGTTAVARRRAFPIRGVLGDQQAALFGHGLLTSGLDESDVRDRSVPAAATRAVKCLTLARRPARPRRLADRHEPIDHALEGSVLVARVRRCSGCATDSA
jgi:glycerol kinase